MKFLKKIWWWLIDYLYMFWGHARPFINHGVPAAYSDDNDEKGDIVLIPGLMTRWLFLKDIGDYFAKRGYRVHVISNIFYNSRSIRREARELHEYLEEHNIENATVIAHSKGGLVAKHYMANENTADHRVTKLIAIASPFSGSHLTQWVPSRAFAELHPSSAAVAEVAAGTHVHDQVVSIFPLFDNHITHENGSYLEGAKNIALETHGHHKILFDSRLPKIIEQELQS